MGGFDVAQKPEGATKVGCAGASDAAEVVNLNFGGCVAPAALPKVAADAVFTSAPLKHDRLGGFDRPPPKPEGALATGGADGAVIPAPNFGGPKKGAGAAFAVTLFSQGVLPNREGAAASVGGAGDAAAAKPKFSGCVVADVLPKDGAGAAFAATLPKAGRVVDFDSAFSPE